MDPTQWPQPLDGTITPRFAGPVTFMRLPQIEDASILGIALLGVPFDLGTTNRPGARHGPREIRSQSSLMRRVHHVSGTEPFSLARVADVGDVSVNPVNLLDGLKRIEAGIAAIVAAGALPLIAGGDHLTTLATLRAVAQRGAIGMIHFDAHSDTNDTYFGDNPYTHGTPFRRAIEEGLLDGLDRLEDEAVVERLTRVRGVGLWTAEMFLMFGLGRPDVWPVRDLGLRRAAARLFGVAPEALPAFGEAFRPYRSHLAWYLWRSLSSP